MSITAFKPQEQNWVVVTETMWSAKTKIFSIWPLTEKLGPNPALRLSIYTCIHHSPLVIMHLSWTLWFLSCIALCMLNLYNCVHVWVLNCLSHVQLFAIRWTLALQAPLSTEFSRQEYWSGLLCFPPGDLPDPGIKPTFLLSPVLAGGFFTSSATWEAP